jgi:hypothetical protein
VSIPVDARVRAVPTFVACIRAAHAFMAAQDADSAPERLAYTLPR